MPITQADPMKKDRNSKPYNTYHGLTGKSSLGGKRVLKHPHGRKNNFKSQFKSTHAKRSRGMRSKGGR
jgi:hypothetical protein